MSGCMAAALTAAKNGEEASSSWKTAQHCFTHASHTCTSTRAGHASSDAIQMDAVRGVQRFEPLKRKAGAYRQAVQLHTGIWLRKQLVQHAKRAPAVLPA